MLGKDVINCHEEQKRDKRISKTEFLISSVTPFLIPFFATPATEFSVYYIHLYVAKWYTAFLLI